MKRHIWTLSAILILLFGMTVPASAATDPDDYIGELDPATGLPLGTYETADGKQSSYITVDDAFCYDPDAHLFLYTIGSSRYTSNVPNGAVVPRGQTVSIQLPRGITGELHRDSAMVPTPNLGAIKDPGFYVLQLSGSSLYDHNQFTFTIMPELTNQMTDLRLPEGFSFAYILLDGKQVELSYSNYFEFKEDGTYQVDWKNDTIDRQYTVRFTLDRQAPTLALPGVTHGRARSVVPLSDLEENCYITMEHNGKTQTLRGTGHILKETGDYVLTVHDPAGNYTQYRFHIDLYLNFSAVLVLIMVLAILAGIAVYCWRVRKHVRVG